MNPLAAVSVLSSLHCFENFYFAQFLLFQEYHKTFIRVSSFASMSQVLTETAHWKPLSCINWEDYIIFFKNIPELNQHWQHLSDSDVLSADCGIYIMLYLLNKLQLYSKVQITDLNQLHSINYDLQNLYHNCQWAVYSILFPWYFCKLKTITMAVPPDIPTSALLQVFPQCMVSQSSVRHIKCMQPSSLVRKIWEMIYKKQHYIAEISVNFAAAAAPVSVRHWCNCSYKVV